MRENKFNEDDRRICSMVFFFLIIIYERYAYWPQQFHLFWDILYLFNLLNIIETLLLCVQNINFFFICLLDMFGMYLLWLGIFWVL